jgi:hypothetical protein
VTKQRPPLDTSAAITRIAGHFPGGHAELGERIGKSASMIRAWGDPERRERVSFDDAIALDVLYMAEGGIGAPLYETYTAQLGIAAAGRFAEQIQLGQLLPKVIKENAEAEAALAVASQLGADTRHRGITLREVEEAIAQWQQVRVLLTRHQTDPPA